MIDVTDVTDTTDTTDMTDMTDMGAGALGAVDRIDTLVVGCGNLLRGDDGVGPVLVRELWEAFGAQLPTGVELVDGGTAGMDIAFKMRGVREVLMIDAAATGSPPGTVFEVPGEELETLPPLEGLHTHLFRWDHALAFAHWLLKDDYPDRVTVWLVEVDDVTLGAELSASARTGLANVKQRILSRLDASAGRRGGR